RYYITDMNSANGVWLGDERLTPEAPIILTEDVTVRLGDYWMQLLLKPEPTPEEVAAADQAEADAQQVAPAEPAPPPDTHLFDDVMVTQHVEITPKEKPRYTPPYLTAD